MTETRMSDRELVREEGMADRDVSRRTFLRRIGLSTSSLVLFDLACAKPKPDYPRPLIDSSGRVIPSGRGNRDADAGVKLGVASYSLRNFPLDRAIEMTKALGVRFINLKSVHLPYESTPAQIAAARAKIEAAGLTIVGGGMITFESDTDEGVRKYFDYAKAAGMPVIVGTSARSVLPRIERFVKEYDIKLAIHNHGPEDPNFPSPYDALRAVDKMDPRMGLCIDWGHTVRAGTNVVTAVRDAGPRLFDMHAKDLRDFTSVDSQCIVGEGKMPVPQIFEALEKMRYSGYVNLEYEIEPDNPLPGMLQSFAYMRGVLSGIADRPRA